MARKTRASDAEMVVESSPPASNGDSSEQEEDVRMDVCFLPLVLVCVAWDIVAVVG